MSALPLILILVAALSALAAPHLWPFLPAFFKRDIPKENDHEPGN